MTPISTFDRFIRLDQAAHDCVDAGISIIPIAADGTKAPETRRLPSVWDPSTGCYRRPWKEYQRRLPSHQEVSFWFDPRVNLPACGLAAVCGLVSGGLEVIDIDDYASIEPWAAEVMRHDNSLLDRLVFVATPRPGLHTYYRCPSIQGSQKLARKLEVDQATGRQRPKILIETKGEGSYCILPPSPAACHPSGVLYHFVDHRNLTQVPTITADERELLLASALKLNTYTEVRRLAPVGPQATTGNGTRPGDDFNRRADWSEILIPHGWTLVNHGPAGERYWCRPGKSWGTSASTNFGGNDLLHNFSSNAAPFEADQAYTKFTAFTLLNYDGNFEIAALALRELGYGVVLAYGRRGRSARVPR